MPTLLRQPLLWFLCISGALFIADSRTANQPDAIVVSPAVRQRIVLLWETQMGAPPTASELESLIAGWIEEEALYREAIRLGLEREDSIIRRRLVQKLNFIASKVEAIMGKMGPENPLSNMSNYYNVLRKLCESADLDPELYFSNPAQAMAAQKGKPQQPSPEMMKMQAEMGMKKEEAQAKLKQSQAEAQLKAEVDTLRAEKEAEIARFKAELEAAQARENALLEAEVKREIEGNKLKLEYERMAAQHEYKMAELTAEERLERSKMDANSRDGQGNINLSD